MRSLSRWGALCSSRYVLPAMAPGATGRPPGRWVVAAARLLAPSQAAGREAGADAMAERACCGQHAGNTSPGIGEDQHAGNTNKTAFPGTLRHDR